MKRTVLALIAAVLLSPAPALAEQPSRLATQVVDDIGALGSGEPSAEAALAELRDETGLQLFVVFVRSFDGVPAQEWTDRAAELSDLGDRDALLAVATVDRAYAYSFPDDAHLSDGELAEVAADKIEPALSRGDWSGAVVAGADGYRGAYTSSGSPAMIWVLVVFVVVIAGAVIWVVVRRRRAARLAEPPADPSLKDGPSLDELTDQANALLLELDDDLRASERELSIATGQYGPAATGRFKAALETSRQDVAEAFRLRATLDEEPAPELAARRATLTEIIDLCRGADKRLDDESAAFDELRDLEGRAAEVAAEVERRRAEVEASLPAAEAAFEDLTSRYAGPPITAIASNVGQARERLKFTASALAQTHAALADAVSASPGPSSAAPSPQGSAAPGPSSAAPSAPGSTAPGSAVSGSAVSASAVSASAVSASAVSGSDVPGGDRAEAALAVRAAEQAVDQAGQLIAAIHQAVKDLDAARKASDALVLEVQAEIAAGRATLTSTEPATAGGLTEAVRSAEQVLTEARAELAGQPFDPIGLAARLQASDAALDQALADARDATERAARARSLLAQALPVARSEVAAANSYITTRRGGVDTGARSTLAEAERHLALAEGLSASDPVAAVTEAQQAQRLASSASRRARADVQTFSSGYESSDDDLLGGFLGGLLSGGGGGYRRSNYRSRSSWSGGGFGGSGSRSRRTGGGSSGGGRRGGGGRF